MRIRAVPFLLLLTLIPLTLGCSPRLRGTGSSPAEQTDRLFREWDRPDSPGAAVAVTRDGDIVFAAGYGCANLDHAIPITSRTVFDVASVSKQFTAFAILTLAGEGKLSLDDEIHRHLPELPDFGHPITIRHLIHHTSGLKDWISMMSAAGYQVGDVITRDQIMTLIRHQRGLNHVPGEQFLYTNTGYTLLAEIVARVSGQSFREWTTEHIFEPLGMRRTVFLDDHREVVADRACAYAPGDDGGFFRTPNNLSACGSGSLHSTVEDLARWAVNFETGRVGGRGLLDFMGTGGVLTNGQPVGYGFGQNELSYRGLHYYAHTGIWASFRSALARFPEQRVSIIVLCNLRSMAPGRLVRELADIWLAEAFPPEESRNEPEPMRETVAIDPSAYDRLLGRYQLQGPTMIFTVKREGSRLIGQMQGQSPFEMLATSETEYYETQFGSSFTFAASPAGPAEKVTIHFGGSEYPAHRIEDLDLTPEQLAEYEGTYTSEELESSFVIVVGEDGLRAEHRRLEPILLEYVDTDRFGGTPTFFVREVLFERDADGRVVAFLMSGDRYIDMRFVRVDRRPPPERAFPGGGAR